MIDRAGGPYGGIRPTPIARSRPKLVREIEQMSKTSSRIGQKPCISRANVEKKGAKT